ncbi:MAG: hypothetical protein PHF37_08485 [Phycisphaerae bacterium]|jgi:hypothetical protein|nr:hypothetical protein [Phycisphaerae bacterium]
MTRDEIETLAELIAIKTNDRYLEIVEKIIANEITSHSSRCEVNKYRKTASVISAIFGGIIVAVVDWILKK